MGRHTELQKDATFVVEKAMAAMMSTSKTFSKPEEVAAAYLGEVVLAVDDLQQSKASNVLGQAEAISDADRDLQMQGRVNRGTIGGTGTGKGTQIAEQLREQRILADVMTSAGAKGKSLHTLTLAAVLQHDQFELSVKQAFENNGFDLTAKGNLRIAGQMREEIGRMAKESRDSFAAPTAENIQIDFSGMTNPKQDLGNAPS